MCGIVGLYFKDSTLESRLGSLLSGMLGVMTDRGPDSAGFAVYGDHQKNLIKLTLRAQDISVFDDLGDRLSDACGIPIQLSVRSSHAVIAIPSAAEAHVRATISTLVEGVAVIASGERMEVYKEVGLPADVAGMFALDTMSGTHGIGHTRMATESAVTTTGAHPFTTGRDQCLVHNGSLSNHNSIRRQLVREGMTFETKNDSEVAAGYLSWRLREGSNLQAALDGCLEDLDGFFTFVVGTESGFAVLRDPVACKPAIMAETDQYVAFGSEYRALVGLPGIERAHVFEPEPAKVYVWERS